MYTYVSALARTKGSSGTWSAVDIATLPLYQIYALYSDIKAIVTNPVITGDLSVDFADLHEQLRVLTITFPQWLVINGNRTLPTSNQIPTTTQATARHLDAWYWGFDIKPANHTKHPDVELLHDEQTDLYLTKANTNPLTIQTYCIATVNGFAHRLSSSELGTFVLGGCTSGRIANDNQVGLLDFSALGPTETVSLQSGMRVNPVEELPVKDALYINVGKPLLGKTVMVSLAGYLFVLDDCYDVVGESTIKLNIRNMNLLARYYEGRQYVDWSQVYRPDARVPGAVGVAEFFSDTTLNAILDMPQSFVVILDAQDVQVSYAALDMAQLPGVYYAYGDAPVAPLRTGLGRLAEYLSVKEVDTHVVKINGYRTHDPHREQVNLTDLTVVENGDKPAMHEAYSHAKLMLIQKLQLA